MWSSHQSKLPSSLMTGWEIEKIYTVYILFICTEREVKVFTYLSKEQGIERTISLSFYCFGDVIKLSLSSNDTKF